VREWGPYYDAEKEVYAQLVQSLKADDGWIAAVNSGVKHCLSSPSRRPPSAHLHAPLVSTTNFTQYQ